MNLLINTSVLKKGGGLQVAASVLHEFNKIDLSRYNIEKIGVILSPALYGEVEKYKFNKNFTFYFLEKSESTLGSQLFQRINELTSIEKEFETDIVFTVFGPSYWKPKSPHLVGFALPWLIYPKSKAFKELPLSIRIRKKIQNRVKGFFLKRDADRFVVETDDVKERLGDNLGWELDKIDVVSNTVSHYFLDRGKKYELDLGKKGNTEFRFITIASNYPHKNLKILKKVVDLTRDSDIKHDIKFYITIPNEDYQAIFGDDYFYHVINIGHVEHKFCPSLYEQVDALFLPTLLECFTVSYPEAMIMTKPILTSDLSFAHTLCQKAALYFDPLNAKDILDTILKLIDNKNLQQKLIEEGQKRVKEFPTATERAHQYLEILQKMDSKY